MVDAGRPIHQTASTRSRALVTVFDASPESVGESLKFAAELRKRGTACEVYLNPGDKLGKQMAYADRLGIPFAVILGPDEIAQNTVTIKSLKEPPPNQQTLGREEALNYVTHGA